MSSTVNTEARSGSAKNIPSTGKMRERRSTDVTQVNSGFDVQRVYKTFLDALYEPDNPRSSIGTQDYIDGYRELIKFFDHLGYVFKFVKNDVVDKLNILQTFVDKDKNGSAHFDTIQKAIDYETEHNLIKTNPDNFARTLLRLHRALLFIVQLLKALSDRPSSENTATIAGNCYNATLHQHHDFRIRNSVKVGFLMLPSRKKLDDVIFLGRKSELLDQYSIFIKTIQQIYDTINAYYTEKNYLQLP